MSDDFLAPFLARGPIRCQNNSGVKPPFGAVMRVTGGVFTGRRAIVTFAKPNTSLKRRYLVNIGPVTSDVSGSYYWGTYLFEGGPVAYDTGDGTPAIDDEWGVADNSWLLKKDRPGFLITGGVTTVGSGSVVIAQQNLLVSFLGKASASIAVNATNGTVKIFTKNFGADTSLTVANCANYTTALSTDDKVTGSWLSGGPIIAKLVCS